MMTTMLLAGIDNATAQGVGSGQTFGLNSNGNEPVKTVVFNTFTALTPRWDVLE